MSPDLDVAPRATVVVPTRNRPKELLRCLSALQAQETAVAFEVVVVDDGSVPPVDDSAWSPSLSRPVRMVRTGGTGPAAARNAGVRDARGAVVLFTDDDTIPSHDWLETACLFLESHPDHAGVEGPTRSPQYDPLYFHSVQSSLPGSFLTCNVAYQRTALAAVGGFSEGFPSPHAEDLDLGFRVAKLGPVGFDERMTVVHPPMPSPLRSQVRRGWYVVSDMRLYRRHPDLYPWARRLSAPGYALLLLVKGWAYWIVRDRYEIGRNPRRMLRFLLLASGYSGIVVFVIVRDALGWHRTT